MRPGSPENILWGKWCFRWLTKCWKNLLNICVKFAGQDRGSQEGTRPLTVESDERTEISLQKTGMRVVHYMYVCS